jgi:F0F1-type ATP synthase alpha subunit
MSEMVRFDIASGTSSKRRSRTKAKSLACSQPRRGVGARDYFRRRRFGARGHDGDATGEVLSIPVGEELLGRVVSPLGVALDGQDPSKQNKKTQSSARPTA